MFDAMTSSFCDRIEWQTFLHNSFSLIDSLEQSRSSCWSMHDLLNMHTYNNQWDNRVKDSSLLRVVHHCPQIVSPAFHCPVCQRTSESIYRFQSEPLPKKQEEKKSKVLIGTLTENLGKKKLTLTSRPSIVVSSNSTPGVKLIVFVFTAVSARTVQWPLSSVIMRRGWIALATWRIINPKPISFKSASKFSSLC